MPRRRGGPKYDWQAIKRDYIEGYPVDGKHHLPTYADLAVKYGCAFVTIALHGRRESWADVREHRAAKVEEIRTEKRSVLLATTMASFDVLCVQVAERVLMQIERRLDKADDKVAPKPIEFAELRSLAQTARNAQLTGRLALGDSTENANLLANRADKPDLSKLTLDELREMERLTLKARGEPLPGETAPAGATLQ